MLSLSTSPVISHFSFCHASTSCPSTTCISAYRSAVASSDTFFGSNQVPFSYTEYFSTLLFKVSRSLSYAWNIITRLEPICICRGREDGRIPFCSTVRFSASASPMPFSSAFFFPFFRCPGSQAPSALAKEVSISDKLPSESEMTFPVAAFLFPEVSQMVVLYSARSWV